MNFRSDNNDDKILDDEKEPHININDMITKNKRVFNEIIIYIDGQIETSDKYRELCNVLRNATSDDTVKIIISSPGGYLDSTVLLYNHLINTKAKTIAEVYTAYSSASIIALCCDQIVTNRFSAMMIHAMSSMSGGKANEMKMYTDFVDKMNEKFVREAYKTFLTDKEINDVLTGTDFWLVKEDIDARLKKWVPIRKREMQIIAKIKKDVSHGKNE